MGKEDVLKSLERAKYKMDKQESVGLSGMMAIMEALSYIISMLDEKTVIDKQVAAVETSDEKPKKRPKKVPEKIPEKKTVDYGKINALYQAGWMQKEIAEEMGVSVAAISAALKRYKEKREDGYLWDPEKMEFIKK